MMNRLHGRSLKLEGERSSALDLARGRLVLISGCFIVVYLVFALRAFDLAVIQAFQAPYQPEDTALELVEAQPVQEEAVSVAAKGRADVYDRNGELLATTLKTSSLYADTYLIAEPEVAAKQLVEIFPSLAYGKVLQKLQSGRRFEWIKRNVSPSDVERVLHIGEPGLEFKETYRRFYPQGESVVHLLGYGDIDARGLAGIERSFDQHLAQGHELRLSLDMRLQHILRRELSKSIEEFEAKAGAGVIMDVTTGEVLAGVSLPDFNPHYPGAATDEERFNMLTLGVYELGSVFKIFSTAAFFEYNDVPMGVTFDASEPIKVGRHTIKDYHAKNRIMTAPEVFMHSSNIGSALMGQAVGTEKLRAFYKDLGLLDTVDFEIKEVARPLIPHPWREINTLTASYGHGVSTTPLHLAAGVSSIVNGGYAVKPKLVLGENREKTATDVRVVSAQTAQRVRQLLRLVVTEGTGSKAEVQGYRVGGKTGTAEKIVNGRYDDDKKISSFVGVFPMDAPQYAIYIMVDEPKGQKHTWNYATGGWVAAPAVSRVISSMVSVLGIPPASEGSAPDRFGDSLKQYVSLKEGG